MKEVRQMRCVPCEGGVLPADEHEIADYLAQLPDWQLIEVEGVKRITRRFAFHDFAQALAFTNRVGQLAETEGHHPALLTEWGALTVTWWTHAIGGLHSNDFILAARTDDAFRMAEGAK